MILNATPTSKRNKNNSVLNVLTTQQSAGTFCMPGKSVSRTSFLIFIDVYVYVLVGKTTPQIVLLSLHSVCENLLTVSLLTVSADSLLKL